MISVSNKLPEELLQEDWQREILDTKSLQGLLENIDQWQGETVIVPLFLADKRRSMSKENKTIAYLIARHNKDAINYIFSTHDSSQLDKRIRQALKVGEFAK